MLNTLVHNGSVFSALLQPNLCGDSTLGDGNGDAKGEESVRLSYPSFLRRLEMEKHSLRAHGISARQLVLLQVHNTLDDLVRLCALIDLGAVAVPCNPAFSDQQLQAILTQNRYAWLITGDGIQKLHADAGTVNANIINGIFTSGSTAAPKLVCHTLDNHLSSAEAASRINPTHACDHWHLSLPLFHIGGLSVVFRALLAGASLTIGGRVENPQFLARLGITHASMVATQLQRFGNAYAAEKLSLKTVLVGGGPVPGALLDSLPDLPLRLTYGMSEISSQACTQDANGNMQVLQSVKLRLADDAEIQLAGKSLFAGYLEDNQLCKPSEWFATGDIGAWRDGQLQIRGRKDNQFISGGENIQPEAIERQLLNIDGIERALVVPVPCNEYGQRPFAWLDGYLAGSADSLRHKLRGTLPGFMIPVGFAQIPDDILNKGLKLPRAVLEALARSCVEL